MTGPDSRVIKNLDKVTMNFIRAKALADEKRSF